jgi:hypothetical protein
MPFSQGFMEAGSLADPLTVLLSVLLISVWVCFTMYFIIRRTHFKGIKLFIYLLLVMFLTLYLHSQIEIVLFRNSFPVMTTLDIISVMLAGLFPLLATIPILIKFFRNNNYSAETEKINIGKTALKLGIIGILFCCIYWIFGYFVAWQFEELRMFYSGSPEKSGFFQQVFGNNHPAPVFAMFLIQIMRGFLYGLFIVPLKIMVTKNRREFTISVCLVYLCVAFMLIIPNFLFPDIVRYIHLFEVTGSMLLFGIIAGKIMWGKQKTSA